jgi:hypothetical protein
MWTLRTFADDRAAVGAVLRGCVGMFVTAKCVLLSHVNSFTLTEAMAMKEGLKMAEEFGVYIIVA